MEKSKLKFRILILVICCFYLPAQSQEPYQKLLWGPHFNTCKGVTPAWDGGYIFTDRTIAKISVTGDPEWSRNYKVNTWLNSVVKTHDSCYIATGQIWFINTGNHKIFTVKVDRAGNLLWNKLYGGTDETDEASWSICQSSDSNYIIAGTTTSYGVGSNDIYLIKINGDGNVLWAQTIGEEQSEFVNKIKQDHEGNILVIGYTLLAGQDKNIFLSKFDISGDTIWAKTYGGNLYESGHDVIQTSDGGYAILGSKFISATRLADMMLIKTDHEGNFIWAKTYGGNDVDEGRQLWELPDHGFILSGQTESFGSGGDCDPIGPCRDYYLIRTDPFGDTLWTQAYGINGSQDWNQGVILMDDKGYLLFGQSVADYGSNSYLVKTDSNGYCPCNTFSTNTIVADAVFDFDTWGRTSHGIIVSTTTTEVEDIDLAIDSMLCLPVEIPEQDQPSIKIYPNPASNSLNIDFTETTNKYDRSIIISDQVGKIIRNEMVPAGIDNININTTMLRNGFYLVRITNGNNPPVIRKIIINK